MKIPKTLQTLSKKELKKLKKKTLVLCVMSQQIKIASMDNQLACYKNNEKVHNMARDNSEKIVEDLRQRLQSAETDAMVQRDSARNIESKYDDTIEALYRSRAMLKAMQSNSDIDLEQSALNLFLLLPHTQSWNDSSDTEKDKMKQLVLEILGRKFEDSVLDKILSSMPVENASPQ